VTVSERLCILLDCLYYYIVEYIEVFLSIEHVGGWDSLYLYKLYSSRVFQFFPLDANYLYNLSMYYIHVLYYVLCDDIAMGVCSLL